MIPSFKRSCKPAQTAFLILAFPLEIILRILLNVDILAPLGVCCKEFAVMVKIYFSSEVKELRHLSVELRVALLKRNADCTKIQNHIVRDKQLRPLLLWNMGSKNVTCISQIPSKIFEDMVSKMLEQIPMGDDCWFTWVFTNAGNRKPFQLQCYVPAEDYKVGTIRKVLKECQSRYNAECFLKQGRALSKVSNLGCNGDYYFADFDTMIRIGNIVLFQKAVKKEQLFDSLVLLEDCVKYFGVPCAPFFFRQNNMFILGVVVDSVLILDLMNLSQEQQDLWMAAHPYKEIKEDEEVAPEGEDAKKKIFGPHYYFGPGNPNNSKVRKTKPKRNSSRVNRSKKKNQQGTPKKDQRRRRSSRR